MGNMANQHSKKLRGLRQIDDDLWADMETAAKATDTDRSAITRQFYEWFTHRPGATLPQRPPKPPAGSP